MGRQTVISDTERPLCVPSGSPAQSRISQRQPGSVNPAGGLVIARFPSQCQTSQRDYERQLRSRSLLVTNLSRFCCRNVVVPMGLRRQKAKPVPKEVSDSSGFGDFDNMCHAGSGMCRSSIGSTKTNNAMIDAARELENSHANVGPRCASFIGHKADFAKPQFHQHSRMCKVHMAD